MASQWQNFLRNLGTWEGSFASLDGTGQELERTLSTLSLESAEDDRLVHFRLRRWNGDSRDGEPSRDIQQDYRSLGRQVVFFESGAFCKGSLQVAPNTVFGGEFAFVTSERRHRLVHLYTASGNFEQLVLIREFRAGSSATEQPPARVEQLVGTWQGRAATISADWPEPELADCQLEIQPDQAATFRLLPDGGYFQLPAQVSPRQAFAVEGGWLAGPNRLERLIRHYDASGAWLSARHEQLSRAA